MPEPEDKQAIESIVNLVKAGTIPVHEFSRAYDQNRSIAKQTPRFAVLDVENNGPMEAVPVALRRAIDDGFFVGLCAALLAEGRAISEGEAKTLASNLESRSAGVMQRVLRAAGVRGVNTLPAICRAAKATALITANVPGSAQKSLGTGFLVTPSLLLTAAHVVEALLDNMKERPGSADHATVQFYNQLEAPGEWPIKTRFASSWLVSMSPPDGENGQFTEASTPDAAEKLDFALIRLAEPVGSVAGVVDILNPPDPMVDGRLAVIGYQGGSECVLDDEFLQKHDVNSCRLRHGVNTLEGMSGGPCIDSNGHAVGLHEGSMTNVNPQYNRAIHLGAVRKWMSRTGVDPLTSETGPLWGLQDRVARRDWVRAGENLLGTSETARTEWLDQISVFNPDDTRVQNSEDVFHPVFGRKEFQDWILTSSLGDSNQRLALLSGPRGSGKSFSAHILRSRLFGMRRHSVVAIPPAEILNKSLSQAVDFLLLQMGGQPPKGDPAVVRPTAGVLRRDLLPDTFDALQAAVKARSGEGGLLWIVVDIGDDSGLSAESAIDWKQFMIEAEKRAFVRLVITGLSNARRGEFKAAAAKPNDVETRSLSPVSSDEFQTAMMAQAAALRLDTQRWGEESLETWDQNVENLAAPQGRHVMAVRIALEIRAMMIEAAKKS